MEKEKWKSVLALALTKDPVSMMNERLGPFEGVFPKEGK
jgi:hypothetical protein